MNPGYPGFPRDGARRADQAHDRNLEGSTSINAPHAPLSCASCPEPARKGGKALSRSAGRSLPTVRCGKRATSAAKGARLARSSRHQRPILDEPADPLRPRGRRARPRAPASPPKSPAAHDPMRPRAKMLERKARPRSREPGPPDTFSLRVASSHSVFLDAMDFAESAADVIMVFRMFAML
jgi:hypothetical protein